MLCLELSDKPGVKKADDVRQSIWISDPQNLTGGSFQTGAEVIVLVLGIPLQVSDHALKLCQESLQAVSTIAQLELHQGTCRLGSSSTDSHSQHQSDSGVENKCRVSALSAIGRHVPGLQGEAWSPWPTGTMTEVLSP